MSSERYRRSSGVLETAVGEEILALRGDGECFGLNATAAAVWRALAQPKSLDELRNGIREQYSVDDGQCSEELDELIETLLADGLVELE